MPLIGHSYIVTVLFGIACWYLKGRPGRLQKRLPDATHLARFTVTDYFQPFDTVQQSNADEDPGTCRVLVLPDLVDSSRSTRSTTSNRWPLLTKRGTHSTLSFVPRDLDRGGALLACYR
jgi:hypothetical protein